MQMVSSSILAIAAFTVMASSMTGAMAQKTNNSKFSENLMTATISESCKRDAGQVDYTAPELKSCYRNFGMYFSNAPLICSPNCLDASIKAAKKISQSCSLTVDNTKDTPTHVYPTWADEKIAKAACTKNSQGKYCLDTFSSMAGQIANYKLSKTQPGIIQKYNLDKIDWKTELDCDGPCARPFFEAIGADAKKVPVLYWQGYTDFNDYIDIYEDKCGFKRSEMKAKSGTPTSAAAPNSATPSCTKAAAAAAAAAATTTPSTSHSY
ncbi:hypothetical protein BDF22DRAFT_653087 [Syncephalis plumigaleata]|nr:hypothetical protein BDF22DRAFT_653087 [Syncephalis plumigaleata]